MKAAGSPEELRFIAPAGTELRVEQGTAAGSAWAQELAKSLLPTRNPPERADGRVRAVKLRCELTVFSISKLAQAFQTAVCDILPNSRFNDLLLRS
jgi:hypothetical protein